MAEQPPGDRQDPAVDVGPRPRTIAVRVPDEIYGDLRMWAGLKGKTPGDILQEAWIEWLRTHKAEILAELDAVRAEVEAA